MSAILLSVDLEDVRDWVENGHQYRPGVLENTRCYLKHFKEWGVTATFFVVGTVARRYPELIREIVSAGHEIACHGDKHLQLDKLTPADFADDLKNNIKTLKEAGAHSIIGFRAPTFSLTAKTAWAHEVLSTLGFRYSSSVLPAANPLYGWPEFGRTARKVGKSLWEIPMTLHDLPGCAVPIAGGVYFRVLPFFLTRWATKKNIARNTPVGTYFHPYDIDIGQERFMHPDLGNKKHLNLLMYIGRSRVLKRLDMLRKKYPMLSYGTYLEQIARQAAENNRNLS